MTTRMQLQKTNYIKWFMPFCCWLLALHANGRQLESDDKKALTQFITRYKQFYDLLNIEASVKTLQGFKNLYSRQAIGIINDYFDEGTEVFKTAELYFEDITGFFLSNSVITDKNIKVGDNKETYYGKKDGAYFAWIHKTFTYKYRQQEKNISSWVLLTIHRQGDTDGFRIVAVKRTDKPDDSDQDLIPDYYDECVISQAGATVNIYGCNDNPVIQAQPEIPQSEIPQSELSQPEKKKRFSVELTGGGVLPLGTSFANHELLDYKTNTWTSGGALAEKYGYSAGIYVQYNINNWLATGAGYNHFYLPFAEKALTLQLKSFLANSGINYESISTTSTAYRLHMFYVSCSLGTFKNKKTIFKIEPLTGVVNTNIIFPNKLDILINYTNSGQQWEHISLKYPLFIVYGSKIAFQRNLRKKGNTRILVQGYYIKGKSGSPSQQIYFNNLPGNVNIPAPDLQLTGVNMGIGFTLGSHSKKT
jgi:hypothetical protein